MELSDFPRPPKDNGRGVHWSLSVYEWGKSDWGFWAEQLQAMQIKWVKMMDDGGGSGLRLARRLVDIGIMPVVRFYWPRQNPGNIGSRGGDAVKKYLEAGACYFETNNEPDLDLEWSTTYKPDNWLDIVVDNFIIDADIILGLGGYPAMPAFGVGTQRDPFQKVIERGRRDILDGGAWAALHNYCLGRPLEYPNDPVNLSGEPLTESEWEAAGGLWAWEMGVDAVNEARIRGADFDASILTDSTCFRAFEQLNAVIVNAVGHSIPIMMTEGGYNVGQRAGTTFGDDARYPKPTPLRASELNLDMFRFMQGSAEILGKKVPEYFFAVMPWLIAAYRIGVFAAPAENQGPWFTNKYDAEWGLSGELPLVQMLKETPDQVRQDGPAPVTWERSDYEMELGDSWDRRLRYLGVTLDQIPVAPGDSTYWKLVEARWEDEDEVRGGAGYIFVKALDADGQPIEGARFTVDRPGATDLVETKGAVDGWWGNYRMGGALGTYDVRMAGGDVPSERVLGVGLGLEDNPTAWTRTAFWLTFQLVTEAEGLGEESEDVRLDFEAYNSNYWSRPGQNDAADYGVTVEKAIGEEEWSPVYRCIGIHHLLPDENRGNHNVYVDILDEGGNRVKSAVLGWSWEGRLDGQAAPPIPMEKPDSEPGWNVTMLINQTISIWVNGAVSDIVNGLHTRHADEPGGNTTGHHSFYVVFRLQPAGVPDEEPVEVPEDEKAERRAELLAALSLRYAELGQAVEELIALG